MVLFDDKNYKVVDSVKFYKEGEIFNLLDMRGALEIWCGAHIIDIVVIEKVHSMPGQGVASTFKFGLVYGMQIATVVCKQLPNTFVTPQKWTKEIHQGIKSDLKPKEKSQVAMSQLFPTVDFKGPRAKKHHEGLTDALLLAEYWRRQSRRTAGQAEKAET